MSAPDRYEQIVDLAALLERSAERTRRMAGLASQVLADADVVASADASPATHAVVEDALGAAATGPHALSAQADDLDGDALMLRATVHTYRWIDDLQALAERTLGSIAGRAVGYLAPEVALGGSLVSVGVIETDPVDRDGVAAFLSDLASAHPELFDHAATGGGGLADGLHMRSLLTAGVPDDDGAGISRGGLRALGVAALPQGFAAALRDVAAEVVADESEERYSAARGTATAPASSGTGLAALLTELAGCDASVTVRALDDQRLLCLLPGPTRGGGALRLVGGDVGRYLDRARTALATEAAARPGLRVLIAGIGPGGDVAARLALDPPDGVVVDQVITVGSPSAQALRVPTHVPVLSLEDRNDPVAVLGSLVNADAPHRLTVVHDASDPAAAGALMDASQRAEVTALIARLHDQGWLA